MCSLYQKQEQVLRSADWSHWLPTTSAAAGLSHLWKQAHHFANHAANAVRRHPQASTFTGWQLTKRQHRGMRHDCAEAAAWPVEVFMKCALIATHRGTDCRAHSNALRLLGSAGEQAVAALKWQLGPWPAQRLHVCCRVFLLEHKCP